MAKGKDLINTFLNIFTNLNVEKFAPDRLVIMLINICFMVL